MDDKNAGTAGQGLITVMVTPEQVKNGHFLLGRYNDENLLTELKVITGRANVPPATGNITYALIGVAEDGGIGQPLDEFTDVNCADWNGTDPIVLYFKPTGFDHWAYSATAAKGAA